MMNYAFRFTLAKLFYRLYLVHVLSVEPEDGSAEVGIYKRKQESKKTRTRPRKRTRKQEHKNSTKKAIKKTRKQELDQESDQEKKKKTPVGFLRKLQEYVHGDMHGWSMYIS